jgi:hypothetical protein
MQPKQQCHGSQQRTLLTVECQLVLLVLVLLVLAL